MCRGGRALLVAPSNVVYNLLDEFLKWLPAGSNPDSRASRLTKAKVFLVSKTHT
jgi:SNF2 family DNA or RNA helicase